MDKRINLAMELRVYQVSYALAMEISRFSKTKSSRFNCWSF